MLSSSDLDFLDQLHRVVDNFNHEISTRKPFTEHNDMYTDTDSDHNDMYTATDSDHNDMYTATDSDHNDMYTCHITFCSQCLEITIIICLFIIIFLYHYLIGISSCLYCLFVGCFWTATNLNGIFSQLHSTLS